MIPARPSWVTPYEYAQLFAAYGSDADGNLLRPAWVTPHEFAELVREYGAG